MLAPLALLAPLVLPTSLAPLALLAPLAPPAPPAALAPPPPLARHIKCMVGTGWSSRLPKDNECTCMISITKMHNHKNALHWLVQPFDDMCGNDCTEYIKHPVTALTGSACHKRQHGLAGSACHININTPDEKTNTLLFRPMLRLKQLCFAIALVALETQWAKEEHETATPGEHLHIHIHIC